MGRKRKVYVKIIVSGVDVYRSVESPGDKWAKEAEELIERMIEQKDEAKS